MEDSVVALGQLVAEVKCRTCLRVYARGGFAFLLHKKALRVCFIIAGSILAGKTLIAEARMVADTGEVLVLVIDVGLPSD